MKPSQFNIYVDSDDGTILFNSLTRAVLLLGDRCCTSTLLEIVSPADDNLRKMGFLVDDDIDELMLFKHWYRREKYASSKTKAIVLTTYKCNFRCRYCFQEAVFQGDGDMAVEGASRISQWLVGFTEFRKSSKLEVTFFGGEPLVNIRGVYALLDELRQRSSVPVSFHMVTNGSLLTPDVSQQLASAGLTSIQVSIDGPKEIHDQRRTYRGKSDSTYDDILDNLRYAAALFDKIYIAPVLDSQNASTVEQLLRLLSAEAFSEKVQVEYGLLSDTTARPEHFQRFQQTDPEAAKTLARSISLGNRYGFNSSWTLFDGICPREGDFEVIIDPTGNLYSCISGVGDPIFWMGQVGDDPLSTLQKHGMWKAFEPWEQNKPCYTCEYLPVCRGGCRHIALLRKGDARAPLCLREFIEPFLSAILKEYVKHQQRQGVDYAYH